MKVKDICITALGIALYVCVSMLLKIPVINHISLDLGYIILAVYCYRYGPITGAIVGFSGAFLVSLIATGWLGIEWPTGNLFIGAVCGYVYNTTKGKKYQAGINMITTIIAVFIGISLIKTILACAIYDMPFIVKFISNSVAFAMDAIVMCIGLIMAMEIKVIGEVSR